VTALDVSSIRRPLVRWYRKSRRDLPWRRTSDPYAIWVSEVMLQQTRVATVIAYYDRFLARFPTVAALASAREEQVLAAWSGLGYYRRARALHAGARVLVERHDGRLPRDPALLRQIPGVGRYTAGAIASVAFGLPEPIVDGNVRRVLARVFAIDARRVGRAREERQLWELAGRLVAGPDPGDLNQALMELGATVCRTEGPACEVCPVARSCAARARGAIARYPSPTVRRAPVERHVAVALLHRRGRVLLEKPGGTSPLRGTWDVPAVVGSSAEAGAERLRSELRDRHGLAVELGEPVARHTHGILESVLRIEVHAARLLEPFAGRSPDLRWVRPAELDEVAVSGATRKVLRAARPLPAPRPGSAARTSTAPRTRGATPRTPRRARPSRTGSRRGR
jgi:A/G-specific adenine glycosylase